MSLARVQQFSISLDGFGTGEGQSLEAPFGHAGERLHEWMFTTRWWRERLGELAHGGRSAAQALDDQPPAGIGQRMEDAVDRLTPGALVRHPLKYTERSPLSRQPAGGLMRKVLFDISMSLDGFYGGAWRGAVVRGRRSPECRDQPPFRHEQRELTPSTEGAPACHSPAFTTSPSRSTASAPASLRATTHRSATLAKGCTNG